MNNGVLNKAILQVERFKPRRETFARDDGWVAEGCACVWGKGTLTLKTCVEVQSQRSFRGVLSQQRHRQMLLKIANQVKEN